MLDDAHTYFFADQSVDNWVDGWWNDYEQDTQKLPNIFGGRGESVTHNYDK